MCMYRYGGRRTVSREVAEQIGVDGDWRSRTPQSNRDAWDFLHHLLDFPSNWDSAPCGLPS